MEKIKNYPEIKERFERLAKEDLGWLLLVSNSLKEVWDNDKDEEIWKKYL